MRIVVKVGSSSLVSTSGQLQLGQLGAIVDDVASVIEAGHDVVLVSSGAIATGLGVLGKTTRPRELPALQAASAVGQGALFAMWSSMFAQRRVTAAQVLLTMHDASHRTAWVNARNTLEQLLAWRGVPIVNENDTTATDEITFGDNDTLAAQVAVSLNADLLVLLTDTEGLYTEHPDNPDAILIDTVDDHSLLHRIDTAQAGSHWGSGGMRSKVIAAEMASVGGTTTFICRAATERVVTRLAAGEHLGTRVVADQRRGSSFKLWLRYAKRPAGSITVDAGAHRAIVDAGASLLPVGIATVDGTFQAGDAVTVACDEHGEFAKGIVEYAAPELTRLAGDKHAARGALEAIHRDQLVVYDSILA
jgi:glutamate 5-kinase